MPHISAMGVRCSSALLGRRARQRRALAWCSRSAAVLVAAFAIMTIWAAATARAMAQSSWEIGCSQRVVMPGPGDAVRMMNCSRQADCQAQANRAGRTIFENGCFGVTPSTQAAERQQAPAARRR